jgi:hypothetical protein
MVLDQLKIRSRYKLLFIAWISLLLANIRHFIAISHRQTSLANLLGILLTFFVVWNLFQIHGQPSAGHQDKFSDSWKVATFAVTGTALLIVSRFVHLGSSLHGLLNIAGWFLIIACWSFPTSRAQSFAISGVCLIALYDIRWREFSVFGGLNIYVTIALLILWLTVSALTYLFLSRRKPTPSPQGLN